MIKPIFIFCFLYFLNLKNINAQVDSTNNNKEIIVIESGDAANTPPAAAEKYSGSRDRLVIDLTIDNWDHDIDDINIKFQSRGFNAYFMYDMLLGKKKQLFSVAPGIGIGTSHIFSNNSPLEDSTGTHFVKRTDKFKRNKFAVSYIDVPVELRFRTKPNAKNKSWKVAVGLKAGILVDSKTKLKQKNINGDTKIFKEKRFDDLERFRVGSTFRFGYGPFNIIAFYSFTELFDKGDKIHPFSIGISINGL